MYHQELPGSSAPLSDSFGLWRYPMVWLEYVVRGVKKLTSGLGRTRLPITLDLLVLLWLSWHSKQRERDAMMLWATALLCFFEFLWVGEVVVLLDSGFDPSWHLSVVDVSVDNHTCPTYVAVQIKALTL